MTSELSLDAVLELLLASARDLTGARYAAIGILDRDRRSLSEFRTSGFDDATKAAIGEFPRGRGVLGVLISNPRPLRMRQLSDHPRSYGFPPGHPPMGSFLGVPILIRGQAWGNLYLTEKADGAEFTAADQEDLETLAGWAAIAVDNARRYDISERRRAELEFALGGMEASMVVAESVSGKLGLDRVLELIVKRGRALVSADSLLICLLDGDQLRLANHAGNGGSPPGLTIPVAGSSSGRALTTGHAVRVDDISQLQINPVDYGIAAERSALIVPLVFQEERLGVLFALDHLGPRASFNAAEERALRAFAASAATAVATTRSVSRERLRVSMAGAEAERRRWARELHDQTLQGLGALKLALSAGVRAGPDSAPAVLDDAIARLGDEINALRSIVTDLRPAALDELGLEPALSTLAADLGERSGLAIDVQLALGDQRLPPEVETTVYRVAQEALTNVVKHASAETASIRADVHEESVTLSIADNGHGLDQGVELPPSAFGLLGMRERAELAGGRLTVTSGARGTTVELLVPIG